MPKPSTKSAANRFKQAASGQSPEPLSPPVAEAVAQAAPIDDDGDFEPEFSTEVEYVRALVTMKPGSSVVVDVPEWEIDVLRQMHGHEAIRVEQVHYVDYPHNASVAFQYLKNKYKTREQEDIIDRLYPRLRDFAKSTGLPYQAGDEGGSQMQKSEVIDNTPLRTERKTKQGAAGSGARGSAGA
jgi:hypothetical protein